MKPDPTSQAHEFHQEIHADLAPGFTDETIQSQAAFRAILSAFASPGESVTLGQLNAPPQGLEPALATAALTLIDFETTIWLPPACADIGRWLSFHSGAPTTSDPLAAQFALVPQGSSLPKLTAFNQGEDRFPDRSTTLIVAVDALEGGAAVVLTGPGIKTSRTISPKGLPLDFWGQWAANSASFPLGVDVILTAGEQLLALPRSVHCELQTGER